MTLTLRMFVFMVYYSSCLARHISHFMHKVPFPSSQRPRILVQVRVMFAAYQGRFKWIILVTLALLVGGFGAGILVC